MNDISKAYYGALQSNHPNSLKHYGVLGMRWGVRHDKANKYATKTIKRNARAAKKRIKEARSAAVDKTRTKEERKQVKQTYKKAIKGVNKQTKRAIAKSQLSAADRLYSMNSSSANRKVINEGRGKTALKTMLMGSYGALKYDQIRASGSGRVKTFLRLKYTHPLGSAHSNSARNEYMMNVAKRENVNSVKKEQKDYRKKTKNALKSTE